MDTPAPEPILSHDEIEAIAHHVREVIRGGPAPARFVDAATLARILGVSRNTVYGRARELRAIRLGSGPRARLRFDLAEATAALRSNDRASNRRPSGTRPSASARKRKSATGDLLPIRDGRPTTQHP